MKLHLIKDTGVSAQVFTEVLDLLTAVPGPIQFSCDQNALINFEEEDVFGEGAIKPMKHSTIQKLKRLGKITDKDMLGGMLKSETAKELYKNNQSLKLM